MTGRFAPSPTGDLHVGNLRTALIAWLSARARGDRFIVRMEDLDLAHTTREHERRQLEDLAALGLDWDGDVMRQSERFGDYDEVIEQLAVAGLTYPCFCSRRDIREANRAPHHTSPGPSGTLISIDAYPGTCRVLTADERVERSAARPAALRFRTDAPVIAVEDEVAGRHVGAVDDFVIRRNDGTPAYHLAVVVDDAEQDVTEVVRGDDLLASTPRHIHLQRQLGLPTPRYLHVPLVVNSSGARLAKRDGAVTLRDLAVVGVEPPQVLSALGASLGLAAPGESVDAPTLLDRFDTTSVASLAGKPVLFDDLQSFWEQTPCV